MKPSKDLEKWFEEKYPKNCQCGVKIKEHKLFLNGVSVCPKCFHEATKHMKFKVASANGGEGSEDK